MSPILGEASVPITNCRVFVCSPFSCSGVITGTTVFALIVRMDVAAIRQSIVPAVLCANHSASEQGRYPAETVRDE